MVCTYCTVHTICSLRAARAVRTMQGPPIRRRCARPRRARSGASGMADTRFSQPLRVVRRPAANLDAKVGHAAGGVAAAPAFPPLPPLTLCQRRPRQCTDKFRAGSVPPRLRGGGRGEEEGARFPSPNSRLPSVSAVATCRRGGGCRHSGALAMIGEGCGVRGGAGVRTALARPSPAPRSPSQVRRGRRSWGGTLRLATTAGVRGGRVGTPTVGLSAAASPSTHRPGSTHRGPTTPAAGQPSVPRRSPRLLPLSRCHVLLPLRAGVAHAR